MKKKYFFVIVMALVVIVTVPFVVKSFIEKHRRTKGFDNPSATEEIENTPGITDTPEPTYEQEVTPAETPAETPNEEETAPVTATPLPAPAIPRTPKPTANTNLPEINVDGKSYSYFDDALFIGDSRTDALKSYGTIKNADYYCYVGFSVYKLDSKDNPRKSGTGKSLDEFLAAKQYKKVYVMLGFNEVGYNKNTTLKRYAALLDRIQAAQPDAIIYIEANLLVTAECSKKDKYSHNPDIIQLNSMLATLADNEKRFYIDVNELFGDGNGNLREGISGDGSHPKAKYYPVWCQWLLSKTV